MVVNTVSIEWIKEANRLSPWKEARVVVAGMATSGYAAADALVELEAQTLVLDESDSGSNQEKAKILETLGAEVRLGKGVTSQLPSGTDLVVTSPGWRPSQPMLAEAAKAGVPIWSEVELAWRLQQPDRYVPWLGITGTNGKTTTTQMLAAMLTAAGLRTAAVGNIGRPIMETVLDDQEYDVLAVELSSFQLHWTDSLSLHSAVVLNIHPDHLEWHQGEGFEGLDPMTAYIRDKAKIFEQVQKSCIYNVADEVTRKMVEDAEVVEGARAIGFTTGIPAISMLGVVDGLIVDRAFVQQRRTSALPLASVEDVQPYAPHNVENAIAAAALARSFGVPAKAVQQGLQSVQIGGHRIQKVAESDGIIWVDDSKATNPHAANSSMRAYDSIVWIAGGQAKGTSFDQLVQTHADKLRGVVLLGIDRQEIADSLTRHAPQVPVVLIHRDDTGAMSDAVKAANDMAKPGDTVLLAPGCASLDMWSGYEARGEDFQASIEALIGVRTPSGSKTNTGSKTSAGPGQNPKQT